MAVASWMLSINHVENMNNKYIHLQENGPFSSAIWWHSLEWIEMILYMINAEVLYMDTNGKKYITWIFNTASSTLLKYIIQAY